MHSSIFPCYCLHLNLHHSRKDHAISATFLNSCFQDFITAVKRSLLRIFITCISRKWKGFSLTVAFRRSPIFPCPFLLLSKPFLHFSCLGNSYPFFTTYSSWPAFYDLLHLPKVVDVSLLWVPHLLLLLLLWTFQNVSWSGEPYWELTRITSTDIGHYSSLEPCINLNELMIG